MKNLILSVAAAVLTTVTTYGVERNIEVYDKDGNQVLVIPVDKVDRIDIVEMAEEVDLYGDGTVDSPYTVLGAINADKVSVPVYITGYMVGYFDMGYGSKDDLLFGLPPEDKVLNGKGKRAVVIADTKEETDPYKSFCIIADDEEEGARLNLKDSPDNYLKKVTVTAVINDSGDAPRATAQSARIVSIEQ